MPHGQFNNVTLKDAGTIHVEGESLEHASSKRRRRAIHDRGRRGGRHRQARRRHHAQAP